MPDFYEFYDQKYDDSSNEDENHYELGMKIQRENILEIEMIMFSPSLPSGGDDAVAV